MDYQELIERLRNSCEDAIQPDDVYEAADLIEQLQAENKRTAAERDELKNKNALLSAHVELYGEEARRLDDLSTDYARRIARWVEKHDATKAERDAALAELAKYRDAPCVAYATTNEEDDLTMLFFDEDEARKYSGDDEPIKLYTIPPTAEQIANETAEACAKYVKR